MLHIIRIFLKSSDDYLYRMVIILFVFIKNDTLGSITLILANYVLYLAPFHNEITEPLSTLGFFDVLTSDRTQIQYLTPIVNIERQLIYEHGLCLPEKTGYKG